jgi:hypothetical protein
MNEVLLCALDEKIRTLLGEAVVEADVIWDEIEEELDASLFKPLPKTSELGIPT